MSLKTVIKNYKATSSVTLEVMDKFLYIHTLPTFNQEVIGCVDSPIKSNEIESVIINCPSKKIPASNILRTNSNYLYFVLKNQRRKNISQFI